MQTLGLAEPCCGQRRGAPEARAAAARPAVRVRGHGLTLSMQCTLG